MDKPSSPPSASGTPAGGPAADRLVLRRVGIDTYRENVAFLHRDCLTYRAEGFQALAKVEVSSGDGRVLAVLNVVDDDAIVGRGELGLSLPAFAQLGAAEGAAARIAQAEPPRSMVAVRRKMFGERLSPDDYRAIVDDIAASRYAKTELAAFLVTAQQNGLDRDEVLSLTRAMLDAGEQLCWDEPLVADKHCIGGIPGNRTSMLVVPIVAAHGTLIAKTSSRAITSPAGTADTMEVLAAVDLDPARLQQIVRAERACLAWGGRARLSPADDVLIAVERPLGIDSQGQMVASILSKKLAAGSTHLLIDIPVGPYAKVRHMRQAMRLRKLFEYVADRLGLHCEVVITDGRQPVGRGVGPVLEARDVMQVLQNDPQAPLDLREKALRLAGRVIEFDPDVRGGFGYRIAREILESGRALAKMGRIVDAQGRRAGALRPGRLNVDVSAPAGGTVVAIDNLQIARVARLAGAPMDKSAGVDVFKRLGDEVVEGEPLYRIYAEFGADFAFARRAAAADCGYRFGAAAEVPRVFTEF